jgi:outer membrane protein OmpA-like peptidoglycan-associated protein
VYKRQVITLLTDSSKQYTFEVRKNDILLIKKDVSLSIVEDKPVENLMTESAYTRDAQAYSTKTRTSSFSSNNSVVTIEDNPASANKESDGRFNIIGGGKYLTYSGNTNSSSSHFIIQVGDAIASNDPNLKNTTYLKAQEQLEVPFEQGSTLAEDVFYFENIRIVQRLTPVDSLLNPIAKNTWGSVYKIEYELENYSLQDKVINFLTLSDFMLDKNDNPRAYINQTKLLNSWTCDKSEMPESIQLRLKNSSTNMRARCILKNNQLNGPDSLSYGNWQFLRQLTYLGKNKNQEVVDNALLLKWSKLPIAAQTKKTISYAYGFTGQGKVDLELINTSIQFIESVLYFNMGANQVSTKIWKLERKKIAEMKPSLEHIELIGHTDAKGNAVSNIRLSKLRCLGIKLLMIAEGVDKNIISIKPMGEQEADQSIVSRKKGRREAVSYTHLRAHETG